MTIVTEPELTDEEWREQTFGEERLLSDRLASAQTGGRDPSLSQLKDALERFGPDGILESAVHLPRAQYEQLAKLVRRQPKQHTPRRRRK